MAYLRPIRGLDGAGDGGRLWPSRSILENAFPSALALEASLPPGGGADEDIAVLQEIALVVGLWLG